MIDTILAIFVRRISWPSAIVMLAILSTAIVYIIWKQNEQIRRPPWDHFPGE